jgi:hypothetical protein
MTIQPGDKFIHVEPGADHYETFTVEAVLSTGAIAGVFSCQAHPEEDAGGVYQNEHELLHDDEGFWKPWDGVSEVQLIPVPPAPPQEYKYGNWYSDRPNVVAWFDTIEEARDADELVRVGWADNDDTPFGGHVIWSINDSKLMDQNTWRMLNSLESISDRLQTGGLGGILAGFLSQ